MKYKTFPEDCNTEEVTDISLIVGKVTVSGGTNLVKLDYFDVIELYESALFFCPFAIGLPIHYLYAS